MQSTSAGADTAYRSRARRWVSGRTPRRCGGAWRRAGSAPRLRDTRHHRRHRLSNALQRSGGVHGKGTLFQAPALSRAGTKLHRVLTVWQPIPNGVCCNAEFTGRDA